MFVVASEARTYPGFHGCVLSSRLSAARPFRGVEKEPQSDWRGKTTGGTLDALPALDGAGSRTARNVAHSGRWDMAAASSARRSSMRQAVALGAIAVLFL